MLRKAFSPSIVLRNIVLFLAVGGFIATVMGWKSVAEFMIVGLIVFFCFVALLLGLLLTMLGPPKRRFDEPEEGEDS